MLSSKERISTPLFKEISGNKGAVSVYNNLGTLKYVNGDTKKLSVVVGAKTEKRAVYRNKIKRRVYSIFSKIDIKIHGILYVSKKSATASFSEIKSWTNDLVEKIKRNTK